MQLPQRQGVQVAQCRARTARQHRRELAAVRKVHRDDEVDSSMQRAHAPGPRAPGDGGARHAGFDQLPVRHDAVLPGRNGSNPELDFSAHRTRSSPMRLTSPDVATTGHSHPGGRRVSAGRRGPATSGMSNLRSLTSGQMSPTSGDRRTLAPPTFARGQLSPARRTPAPADGDDTDCSPVARGRRMHSSAGRFHSPLGRLALGERAAPSCPRWSPLGRLPSLAFARTRAPGPFQPPATAAHCACPHRCSRPHARRRPARSVSSETP